MTTPDDIHQPLIAPESKQPEHGTPSPVLVIFLVIPLLGILVALLMVAADLRTQQSTLPPALDNPPTLINYTAPHFELSMLDGTAVALEDYRGKVLFLNFWQTTCPPCVVEMPEFINFMADQNPDEVALLAINVEETPEQIRAFFAEHDIIGIPTALDPDASVRWQYGVKGLPATFVINDEGVIRFVSIGAMTYDDMEEFLSLAQTTDVSDTE